MWPRILFRLFVLTALATFAVAIGVSVRLPEDSPPFERAVEVEHAERELSDDVLVDQEHTVEFRVINKSLRVIRVIGSEYS